MVGGDMRKVILAASLLALTVMGVEARTVLFLGSSMTFGARDSAQHFKPQLVTDLNGPNAQGETYGGVPAIFKQFTLDMGLKDYEVSSQLVGGRGLEYWFTVPDILARINKPWDFVVMHGHSTLDQQKYGDRTLLLSSSKNIAKFFLAQNPNAKLYLFATWGRPDLVYPANANGPWKGTSIQQMGQEVHAAYQQVVKEEPRFAGIVPVGLAFNRAIETGVADGNPYDDLGASKVNLWAYDSYHGSNYGYFLKALLDFGTITGLDPRALDGKTRVPEALGISPAQSKALMQVAFDTLQANR